MSIEYKSVSVNSVTQDKRDGRVTAFVSITGVEDNVKDVILPSAYTKTLKARTPKGAWGHDWKTPTARTESVTELPPGHKDLPATLSDGMPWPKEAGALKIDMKFNLGTQRGREAYSDVKFFGDQQEWSIGYSVPDGKSYTKDGVRYIKELNLYEYSPVLFGAMTHARSVTSVKDAQISFKAANGDLEDVADLIKQIKEARAMFELEFKDAGSEGVDQDDTGEWEGDEGDDESEDLEDEDETEEDEEDDSDEDEDDEEKSLTTLLRKNLAATEALLSSLDFKGFTEPDSDEDVITAYVEAVATGYDSMTDVVADLADHKDLSEDDFQALEEAAEAFDDAQAQEDTEVAEKAAGDLLDVLESVSQDSDGDLQVKASVAGRVLADLLGSTDTRVFGYPETKSGRPMNGDRGVQAYVADLTDEILIALPSVVESKDDFLDIVNDEIEARGIKMGGGYTTDKGPRKSKRPGAAGKPGGFITPKPGARKRRKTGMPETKRKFTADQRDDAADSGAAMEDGSYPINSTTDLKNAIKAYGRAKNKDAVMAHIKKRAKAMDKEGMLPDSWKTDYVALDIKDAEEFKSLLDNIDTIDLGLSDEEEPVF